MKKINNFLVLIFVFAGIMALNSCQDEESFTLSKEIEEKCPNILYFEDESELYDELKNLSSLSLKELIDWEKNKGFNSFGIKAEEFYDNIDIDGFKCQEDMDNFITENDKYLELVEYEDEYSVKPKFYNSLYRYLINEEKIYQVGDTIYKLLDKCRISAASNNIEKIKMIDNNNIEAFIEDSDIKIIKQNNNLLKSISSNCNTGGYAATNEIDYNGRKYRTVLNVKTYSESGGFYKWVVDVDATVACEIKRFNRWWGHKTGIWADFVYTVRYKNYYGGYYYVTKSNKINKFKNSTKVVLCSDSYLSSSWPSSDPEATFIKYQLKGRTYVDNSTINISCGM